MKKDNPWQKRRERVRITCLLYFGFALLFGLTGLGFIALLLVMNGMLGLLLIPIAQAMGKEWEVGFYCGMFLSFLVGLIVLVGSPPAIAEVRYAGADAPEPDPKPDTDAKPVFYDPLDEAELEEAQLQKAQEREDWLRNPPPPPQGWKEQRGESADV